MTTFVKSRHRLAGVLSIIAFSGILVYHCKRQLNRSCPRVPISQLPHPSACRNLIETGQPIAQTPWGVDRSVVLARWPGEESKTHWIQSFVALQAEVPISQLERDGRFDDEGNKDGEKSDAYHPMQNLVAAFLDADVPTLSFTPGSRLFGEGREFGAFMLGSWSSRGTRLVSTSLPFEAPRPVCEFPSNEGVVSSANADTAGAVMYWIFPTGLVNAVDKAASYGVPWRLMEGGFQEWIVEKQPDNTARVTYVTVECSSLHPRGETTRDFKILPWVLYEFHVLYAQILLFKTLRQLRR
ncbi:hypothetical protein BDW62DRAFT_213557 [Aspergillus aurantiobrunneus]